MGIETLKAIEDDPELALVGQTDLGDDLESAIRQTEADAVVDFTTASAAFSNCKTIIQASSRPVIMMKFASEAARFMPDVEIIELHHEKKADAPSGTAIKTAALIAESRNSIPEPIKEKEILTGARGARANEVPVHSVRLPGKVAHQEVIFGGKSQTLTIRHDSIHRDSFMPGVCLACKKVMDLDELVYGLEHVL